MAGTPPGVIGNVLAQQGWMFVGDAKDDVWSGSSANPLQQAEPYLTNIGYGLAERLNDLLGLTSNPYADITLYDPTRAGEPLYDLLSSGRSLMEETTDRDIITDWGAIVDGVSEKIDDVYDDAAVTAATAAFKARSETVLDDQISKLNNMFSDLNAVNTSTRGLMVSLLEREHLRAADEFQANLELEVAKTKLGAVVGSAVEMIKIDDSHLVERAQIFATLLGVVGAYNESKRQYTNDQMRLDMEDLLWEIKLFQFAQQGIGALSGANVIPGHPNPNLEAVSTVAGIAGALVPVVEGLRHL